MNEDHLSGAFALDAAALAAPLPRAYQFLDGSAYFNHVELVRKARGAELPPSYYDDPLMYQAVSDGFLAPTDDIRAATTDWGIDFEAELTVLLDDVPMGIRRDAAGRHIKLFMLVNDVSLRGVIPAELAKGFGFVVGKPRSALSPVAVTADEFGDAWDGEKLHLPLTVTLNGKKFGSPNVGVDCNFTFARLDRARGAVPAAVGRHDHRLGHRLEQGRLGRLLLPGRAAHHRDDRDRQAQDAVHELRRHGAYRDARQGRPLDLRRDRAEGGEICGAALCLDLPVGAKVLLTRLASLGPLSLGRGRDPRVAREGEGPWHRGGRPL